MDPQKIISIIIVNYNTTDHVNLCLMSINKFFLNYEKEIIVVDNHSQNRDIESLPSIFPEVRFVFRKVNDGFGAGCNEGVKNSTGKYLLFLNPDTMLIDNSVENLLKYLELSKNTGIVSGLLVHNDKTVMYCFDDFSNFKNDFLNMFGLGYKNKLKKLTDKREIKMNEIFEVDWFHGAFIMMSRKDFDTAGGFDENYFMYYEDVELCYKIKKILNKKIYCLPEVRIFHHTQSSIKTERTDNIFTFHMNRGKILFYNSYYPIRKYFNNIFGLLAILIKIILIPFRKKYKGIRIEKFVQLKKVVKLYLFKTYLASSKYEYVKT